MMSEQNLVARPITCDSKTNLYPFFESCLKEVTDSKKKKFASVTFETNYSDPLAILEKIHSPSRPICYYEKPMDEFSIACGEAVSLEKFNGSDRFSKAKTWAKDLFSRTLVAGNHKVEGSGPTIFLNATFEESSKDDSYPSLQTFLPRWQILRKCGSHLITINSEVFSNSSPETLAKKTSALLHKLTGVRDQSPIENPPVKVKLSDPIEENDYELSVEKALNAIDNGNISKIVLARKLSYRTDRQIPYFSIAHTLRNKFPDCYTFCISTPDNNMFIGATPEILSRVSGTSLITEAVAGTAPRGPSADKDAHLGKRLLGSNKEVHEHRLVIDSILRRLSSCGVTDCREGQTRLLRLANLQHARTPIYGKLADNIHPFDTLSALHPTPAMGGSPREKALPLVKEIEKFNRGWYSGIAGWLDSRGRGEFMVPIRCGKISPNKLTLFSGAGIVNGSIPSKEKAETDLKLQAMLNVITGRSDLSSQ